jgi:hypothetical protein
MEIEVVIGDPWQHITRAIGGQDGRIIAAIAYVTKRLLDLRRGDVIVCDASEAAVKAGQTDPKVLLAYLRRGVSVFSHPGLHAKAVARGRVAVVGSANSSNASADGLLAELVAILRRRPAVVATRQRIEMLARRSVALDPITLTRLSRLFIPGKEFRPMARLGRGKPLQSKARAWCVRTRHVDEHADLEKARQRGTPQAERSAQSRLGKQWRGRYRIDNDVSWGGASANKFELGDQIFDVLEGKTLRPPGVLVHKEPSNGRLGSVLFICRERMYRSRRMKHVRTQTDQKTYQMLRKAEMRQLSPEQLDRINQLFGP